MNRQLALAIQLNDEATLSDFFWGENTLLQTEIERVVQQQGEPFLFLWGNTGCGKSYLLQACCQAIVPASAAIYLPLDILKDWGAESIDGLGEQALVAIDDIDCIAGNSVWEEALFHLYNKLRDNPHSRLIITSKQSPNQLAIRLPDLRSRLLSGLAIHMKELDDAAKIKTLQHHAQKRGFELPTIVGQFLLKRCARNMHELHQLLNFLDEASLMAQRKITIPFVKHILQL